MISKDHLLMTPFDRDNYLLAASGEQEEVVWKNISLSPRAPPVRKRPRHHLCFVIITIIIISSSRQGKISHQVLEPLRLEDDRGERWPLAHIPVNIFVQHYHEHQKYIIWYNIWPLARIPVIIFVQHYHEQQYNDHHVTIAEYNCRLSCTLVNIFCHLSLPSTTLSTTSSPTSSQ